MPLPRGARPPLPGLRQRRAAGRGRRLRRARSEAGALAFARPLQKEGRLGFWRWTLMFFSVAGTYRKNDSVDVQYASDGEPSAGHRARHRSARRQATAAAARGRKAYPLTHANRPDPRRQPSRASRSSSSRRRTTRAWSASERALAELQRRRPGVRVGHLRRGRLHARPHGRDHQANQERVRARGDGAPLLCGHDRGGAARLLDEMRDAGIENVLALRGDPPRGETEWKPHPGGLATPPS